MDTLLSILKRCRVPSARVLGHMQGTVPVSLVGVLSRSFDVRPVRKASKLAPDFLYGMQVLQVHNYSRIPNYTHTVNY